MKGCRRTLFWPLSADTDSPSCSSTRLRRDGGRGFRTSGWVSLPSSSPTSREPRRRTVSRGSRSRGSGAGSRARAAASVGCSIRASDERGSGERAVWRRSFGGRAAARAVPGKAEGSPTTSHPLLVRFSLSASDMAPPTERRCTPQLFALREGSPRRRWLTRRGDKGRHAEGEVSRGRRSRSALEIGGYATPAITARTNRCGRCALCDRGRVRLNRARSSRRCEPSARRSARAARRHRTRSTHARPRD